jgi:predicted NodU family carbamoyl transferase
MHDGGGWDLNTQCGYCDDADEVAALEQERADLIRERNETPSLHMAQTIRDLRAAIREKEVDIEALCQLTAIVCARPEGNGYVPTDEEKTLLLNHAYRLRARTEGENDAND